MSDYELINGDCIIKMQELIDNDTTVDMILTDIPYGTVKGLTLDGWNENSVEWDNTLPTKEMFDCCEKLLRMNGVCILFSQEPYTSYLRQFNPTNLNFVYPLYWIKDHFANPLSCKKAPVSYVEDLTVYRKKYDSNDLHPLREYAQNLLHQMNMTSKEIERELGHRKAEHFFYKNGSSQFSLCTKETYDELIDVFNIDKLPCFKSYSELEEINSKFSKSKFNLNDNEKYKSNVLEYPKSYNHYHPTEKPVPLLKDLILTYSDAGDTILDFTMGSGSTGVACLQTDRNFIGIELDEKYYDIAEKRCNEC